MSATGVSLVPALLHRSPESGDYDPGMTTTVTTVDATTLGECWLRTSAAILAHGPTRPTTGCRSGSSPTWRSRSPIPIRTTSSSRDTAIPPGRNGCTPTSSAPRTCPSSGNARSYAARLFDYEGSGRDQLAWVVDRLRSDGESRSATITTFEPLSDTSYIPCVSLLDFWAPAGRVELVVYAHSLDFGKKAYGNLVELARLQEFVAGGLGLPLGSLTIYVKSAHIYEPEWADGRARRGRQSGGVGLCPGAPARAGPRELKPPPAGTFSRRVLRRA